MCSLNTLTIGAKAFVRDALVCVDHHEILHRIAAEPTHPCAQFDAVLQTLVSVCHRLVVHSRQAFPFLET